MIRRQRRWLLVFMIVVVAAGGCSKQSERHEGMVVVTFWHSFVAATIPALEELLQGFEEAHPNIQIQAQYIPTGDALVQKLVAAIQSETAPDVSWIHADFLDKLVEADAIYPLSHFIDGKNGLTIEEMSDFVPASLEAGRWKGTQYALPMEATMLALFYNKDLFRAAGLDPNQPPQTWDELHHTAKQLTLDYDSDGKTDQYGFFVPVFPASGPLNIWMNLQWVPFLWQAGGDELNADGTRILFNSTAGVQALTLWKRLYDDLDFGRFGLSHDMGFASGKIAMILDGPWDLPRFRELRSFEWAVAPLPAGPAGSATYLAGEQLVVFRQSRVPDAAWTFVKWVVQPEVQALFSMRSGYLPVRTSALSRPEYLEYLGNDEALAAFVRQMNVARPRRSIDYHRVEINRALAEAIERSTVGKGEPKRELDRATEQANALLTAARQRASR
jgi:multiple sugar transport system substrate-binding protein